MGDNKISIVNADTTKRIEHAKALFRKYADALNFDLGFQDFDQELKSFPDQYSQHSGGYLLLALNGGEAIGCVGLRRLEAEICEMKRLYVKPGARGLNVGRMLAETVIRKAKSLGYSKMRLDTLSRMKGANHLYRSLGFKEIPPYRYNPFDNAVYLELKLR